MIKERVRSETPYVAVVPFFFFVRRSHGSFATTPYSPLGQARSVSVSPFHSGRPSVSGRQLNCTLSQRRLFKFKLCVSHARLEWIHSVMPLVAAVRDDLLTAAAVAAAAAKIDPRKTFALKFDFRGQQRRSSNEIYRESLACQEAYPDPIVFPISIVRDDRNS